MGWDGCFRKSLSRGGWLAGISEDVESPESWTRTRRRTVGLWESDRHRGIAETETEKAGWGRERPTFGQ